MLEDKITTLSERCRALAEGCRSKSRSFRNEKPRTQMFQLAADYERKARLAEAWEARFRIPDDSDTPLAPGIPEISEEWIKGQERRS